MRADRKKVVAALAIKEWEIPMWMLKGVVGTMFAIMVALIGWSWKGMAQEVEQTQQGVVDAHKRIGVVEKAITKMEAYQEADQAQQTQQTQILQKMLEAVQQNAPAKAGGDPQ